MLLAGFDLGSSSVKLSIVDVETNTSIFNAQYPDVEMPMISHQKGWAEQDPERWWDAIIFLAKMAATHINAQDISALGISYQMHGLVCLDDQFKVLRPSIIWCDSRAIPFGEKAHEALGHEFCMSHLLNSPGNFTAAKLAWVKTEEPKLYEKIKYIMLPGDYIATRMSGTPTTTLTGLSEGIFYDFKEERVSTELLQTFGFSSELLPPIVPCFGAKIGLAANIARDLGWPSDIPICYRAGDQANNALSLNVLEPGEVAATAGTSGVVYGIANNAKADQHSRVNSFLHVNHRSEDPRIGVLLCINGTGILNAWTKRLIKCGSYGEMNQLAMSSPVGSRGLSILPFGNGSERMLKNKYIGSHWLGIDFNLHSDADIARGVQEGIACAMKYGFDIMKELGVKSKVIRAGEANLFYSPLFREAVSALTGADIELYNTDGAQGAARGAGIGLGVFSFITAFSGLKIVSAYQTSSALTEAYQEVYQNWHRQLSRFMNN